MNKHLRLIGCIARDALASAVLVAYVFLACCWAAVCSGGL